jgi:hypothetical protein
MPDDLRLTGWAGEAAKHLSDVSGSIRIEGQPPSGNHMYEGFGKNRRKTDKVTTYQETVVRFVRMWLSAGWKPGERIVINYYFHVGRDIDCTNAIKVIEDGIAAALCPGLDPPRCCRAYDTRFLPRAIEKTVGNREPYVTFELVNE